MKLRLFLLPILATICLSSCKSIPKESSKLFTNEAYYFIDTTYPPFGDKFDKDKTSFMVLRDNYIFGWTYYSDSDLFKVSLIHEYEVRGDTLYYYQVDLYGLEEYEIKYGDTKVYSSLKTKFKETVEKRTDYYNNRYYKIFGTLDYGLINPANEYRQYLIYELAKDFGYAN